MLQPIEIVSGRRSVRRAVQLECDVVSSLWDDAVALPVTNLCEHGAWLETSLPLGVGDEVYLAFSPPGWRTGAPILVVGEIVRVGLTRRRSDVGQPGMAVRFREIGVADFRGLAASLRGLPPQLPIAEEHRRRRSELVWVDEESESDFIVVSEADPFVWIEDDLATDEPEFELAFELDGEVVVVRSEGALLTSRSLH